MQQSTPVRIPVRRTAIAFAVAGVMALPVVAPATSSAATSVAAATPAAAITTPSHAVEASQVRTASKKTRSKKARRYANVKTGPSRWRGKKLRHPRGQRYYPSVLRWANLVRAVMREQKIPRRYLRGILAQIQQESGGNPRIVNRWDSNWRRGTPSMGLLQIIRPTYKAHAKRGYRASRYMKVPYTNIWASLKYVKRTYGMKKFRSWNRGYNQGY